MKNLSVKPIEIAKSQKFFPDTPRIRYFSTEDSDLQVKSVTEQLLREFQTHQAEQSHPVSTVKAKKVNTRQLRATYDLLKNGNRLREIKVRELKEILRQTVIVNGGFPEELPSPCHRSTVSLPSPIQPETRISFLQQEITHIEDCIETEARETERIKYLYEKTNRFLHESRTRCQMMQKQSSLLLGKHGEIQDIEAKSRYDLQRVKTEAQLMSETIRKEAEKRTEKIETLRREKRELEGVTNRIAKNLAEGMVREQEEKDTAEKRSKQLDLIYEKHVRSQANTQHDHLSKSSVSHALHTICSLLNQSETLHLDCKLPCVSLSDLIHFVHQFEMNMSSLESQVQSLSDWKQELEASLAGALKELDTLRRTQFQSAELTSKIQGTMGKLGIKHPCETYNQLKSYLEARETTGIVDEASRYDAFLASSFLTLHIVTKRMLVLLEYVQREIGSHPSKLTELTHALSLSQKQGERLEIAITRGTPTGSDRSDFPDPLPSGPDTELNSPSSFFREALDDIPSWGLDLESIVKETCDLLIVRLFAMDARLKGDVRTWKAGVMDIVGESMHRLLLEEVVTLAHGYLKGKLAEAFGLMRSLAMCIYDTSGSISSSLSHLPLTESQLSVFLDFQFYQQTGTSSKPVSVNEKSIHDIIRKAFDKKYRKLMLQQRPFRLEEESDEFVSKFHIKKRYESLADSTPVDKGEGERFGEENYAENMRKHAKSAGIPSFLSPKSAARSNRSTRIDPLSHFDAEIGAFAEVRSINVKIRALKDSEKTPKSSNSQKLPEIKVIPTSPGKSEEGKGMKKRNSERRVTGRGSYLVRN